MQSAILHQVTRAGIGVGKAPGLKHSHPKKKFHTVGTCSVRFIAHIFYIFILPITSSSGSHAPHPRAPS
ncbi:unnamed protein product [Allacma fusca]|uniref:Uncharacterized protein n=1 Tax=Allacma fusca TaxID=39272 RepID=A0A8J2PFF0_9HEXA|nr:unnamed protein product [Allacma fusca]